MKAASTSYGASRALVLVGMATAWLPLMDRLLYPVAFMYSNTGDTTAYLFNVVYSILAIGLSLAVGIVSWRAQRHSFLSGWVVLLTGAGGAVGMLLASVLDFSSLASMVFIGVGVALVAVYVPVHFIFWSFYCSRLRGRGVLSEVAFSFVLVSLILALFTTMGLSTLPLALGFPAVSAVAGFVFLRLSRSELPVDGELEIAHRVGVLVASLVLILLCNVAIAYFNNSARLQADIPFRAFIFWGQTIVFLVVVYLYLPGKRRRPATMGAFAVVSVTFVGMLFIAIFVSGNLLNMGTVPLNCANTILIAFVWLLIVRDANRKGKSLVFVMALFLALIVFLSRFFQACVMYEQNYLTLFAQSINYVYLVAAITFLAVCLVVVALFKAFLGTGKGDDFRADGTGLKGPSAIPEEHIEDARRAAQFEEALRRLGETAKLSDREMEVARLALKNYSAKKMAQTLFVSENTVYSHLKHIYQKTDVHSKQEFIELVERASRGF